MGTDISVPSRCQVRKKNKSMPAYVGINIQLYPERAVLIPVCVCELEHAERLCGYIRIPDLFVTLQYAA